MNAAIVSPHAKTHKQSFAGKFGEGLAETASLVLFILVSIMDTDSEARKEACRIVQSYPCHLIGWGD